MQTVPAPEGIVVCCDGTGPIPYFLREREEDTETGHRRHLVYGQDIVAPEMLALLSDVELRAAALVQLERFDPEG